MNIRTIIRLLTITPLVCGMGSASAAGFVSGSTGADGAFAPTSDVVVQLPASGILNYTTMSIPAGVTVRYAQTTKVPVVILTTGNANIAGTIDISGGSSADTNLGSIQFQGGLGGPGGYDGGLGGQLVQTVGGVGYGPGGGGSGKTTNSCNGYTQGGGGAGFSGAGAPSFCVAYVGYLAGAATGYGGPAYGSLTMLPMVGGSGGGGGGGSASGSGGTGSGGGGGGGAILLVSSGTVEFSGVIKANGGNAGTNAGATCSNSTPTYGGTGGGGAGGAVRILASALIGAGTINVSGGVSSCPGSWNSGGNGARGYSSVEVVNSGSFNVSTLPSLTFTSIGGVAVPTNTTGTSDVVLPESLANPVTIAIAASGIPVGTVVKLVLNPPNAVSVTANSSPLSGTLQSSTATASISIPLGATVLMGSTTYTLTLAMGEALSIYAEGETVEKVRLAITLSGPTLATLITVSGKEFEVPHAALAMRGG